MHFGGTDVQSTAVCMCICVCVCMHVCLHARVYVLNVLYKFCEADFQSLLRDVCSIRDKGTRF